MIVERPAALDVHEAQVTAWVRVPAAEGGGREQHVAEFATPGATDGRLSRSATYFPVSVLTHSLRGQARAEPAPAADELPLAPRARRPLPPEMRR